MIGAGEFKQHCLALLDEVGTSGEPIVITKLGRVVAQLVPAPPDHQDWRRALRDEGRIIGDPVAPASDPDDWYALRE